MTRAVVDVGSNSVLLLVAQHNSGGWQILRESTWVTGLGTGTKLTGILGDLEMARTLQALREARDIADELGAEEWVAGATMAARIAQNTPDFQTQAVLQGTPVEVLSGQSEAELGFLAIANDPLFADEERLSIIDPGGQSTELVTADRFWHQPAGAVTASSQWKTGFQKSFPIGALGLREVTLASPSPDFMARLRATAEIDEQLNFVYRPFESGKVVALGATGTNLVSIREKFTEWQPERVHGAVLDYEEISRAVSWLMDMDDSQRAEIVGIEKGREKTIHIGALILERFLFALRAEQVVVSVRGWRHALMELGPAYLRLS